MRYHRKRRRGQAILSTVWDAKRQLGLRGYNTKPQAGMVEFPDIDHLACPPEQPVNLNIKPALCQICVSVQGRASYINHFIFNCGQLIALYRLQINT